MTSKIDRISELPEPIILDILSRLPLEDAARASVLSKAWKSFCSLNPILNYDHNLFALQSMVAGGGGEPDINQIRDSFLDDMHDRLSRAMQLDSPPIRKLALNVAFNDSKCYSRLDACLELVKQINVEDLCVFVQSVDYLWRDIFRSCDDGLYEFKVSILAASKHLRSVFIRGCTLADDTFIGDPITNRPGGVSFSSLQQLYLSNVMIDNSMFEKLAKYCQGVETLVLDHCTVDVNSIELSSFPNLKNALFHIPWGEVDHVGVVGTHFERFKCDVINMHTECRISPEACADIRELSLEGCTISQPSTVFADLAATFPLVEEASLWVHDTETFNAVSNRLRKLKIYNRFGWAPVKEVCIDCSVLTSLDCCSFNPVQLKVDCPKLRVLQYAGNTIPERTFFSPMPDLVESYVKFSIHHAYDTLWFVSLRAFLELVMSSRVKVVLIFYLPMTTFEAEQVKAIEVSPRHNVHLYLSSGPNVRENVASFVDAVLFITRPTTLIVSDMGHNLLKYLCQNLMKKKSQDKVCNDERVSSRCWLDELEDFRVENSLGIIDDIKEELLDQADQRPPGCTEDICFYFFWSSKIGLN